MSAETAQLAEFVSQLRSEDMPPAVLSKTKVHTLDQIGCQLAGTVLPWSRIVSEYAATYASRGPSTLIATGAKIDAELAALANATAGHGFEFDDYSQSMAHPGCVAVPAALAIAEQLQSTGEDFLVATAIGFEVITRIAHSAWPEAMHEHGIHSTCAEGVFGAAAAAGWLMDLNPEEMLMAFGIAGSHASGTTEYTQSGGDVKRYHAGLGAAGGIRAVRLAALGLTGPSTILEGKYGLLQAYSSSPRPHCLTEDLGRTWRMLDTSLKPYCCCGMITAQIDGLSAIINEHRLRPDEIERIDVGMDRLSLSFVGTIGPKPSDMTGAQFSTHFSLALTLAKGRNDFWAYQDSFGSEGPDPEVLKHARKVHVDYDAECDALFPKRFVAKVTVFTRDGRRFLKMADAKGSQQNPLLEHEIESKFIQNASVVLTESRARSLMETIQAVENVADVTQLTSLVVKT